MTDAQLLWPQRPADQLQCFFVRTDGPLEPAFEATRRALAAMRFRDFGAFVLRQPSAGRWLVVDWVGPFELSDEAMRSVSAALSTEVLGFGVTVAHGRKGDQVHLHRFRAGESVPGAVAELEDVVHLNRQAAADDPLRLPSSVPMDDLEQVARGLGLPGATELQPGVRAVEIRCVPGRILFWAVVLVTGAVTVLALT